MHAQLSNICQMFGSLQKGPHSFCTMHYNGQALKETKKKDLLCYISIDSAAPFTDLGVKESIVCASTDTLRSEIINLHMVVVQRSSVCLCLNIL